MAASACFLLSFARTDDAGTEHEVFQAEGGEQSHPLMAALYAVAQHPARCRVSTAAKGVFGFLDDTYIVRPCTARGSNSTKAKTRVWNAAREEPPNLAAL